MSIKKYLFLISLIFLCAGLSQTILINEVMSANSTTIADEDGDYSDWIELYNAGETSANLGGVGLSDDPDDLFKWVLPDIQIGPDSHLLIFASDKDRSAISSHWETVINWGDDWKYFIGYSAPPSSWRELDFEDNNWPEGPSGFGYGDGDDATIVQPVISVFIRNTFTIESTDVVEQAILHVDYDDAFVAYLNGVEIARANIGTPGVVPNYNQGSDTWREAQIYAGGLPDVFPVNLEQAALLEGNNVLAIEVHNYEASSSDMSLIPFFTLGMSEIPADPNGSPELLNLQLSPLHTNFKIQSAGEAIYLTAPDEQRLDSLYTSDQPSDISFGRSPDGSENLLLFPNPTPGYENALSGFAGIVPAPEASLTAGFYDSTVSVSLSCPSPSADIHFTLDGSDPTEQSPAYQGSLYFNDTTVLKSRAFETNHLPSPIVTNTYFVQDNSELTVISLSTDPDNLWDYNYGIYVMGPNASPSFPHFGANFWEDWERPIHMELFEPDGSLAFSTGAGVKIFGGWSRGLPQKSLALYARGEYGASAFEYAFFENRPFDSYQALVLRNSGNDWESSMMRDGMMTSLIDNEDVDLQAYRPAAVYINGDYWGIHNIREKINEHFVAAHHDVDPDDIDLLENNGSPIHGDASNYNSLINFLNNEDITLDENYDYVKTLLDINSYVSYQAVQIYFDNQDWPGNNNKFWRPRTEDGKWRWLLYDTDFGFGIWNPNAFTNNTLEYALDPYGPGWPNPPWSTFMLRRLVENEDFRTQFINKFCDLFNSTLKTVNVLAHIDSIKSVIEPEIPAHYDRWGNGSLGIWNGRIDVIENFALQRNAYVIGDLQDRFDLEDLGLLIVGIGIPNTGQVQINSVLPDQYPWFGNYFEDLEIHLTALPAPGFEFTGWSMNYGSEPDICIIQQPVVSVTAHFEAIPGYSEDVVINEINYNSADDFNVEDWVEFYNPAPASINMSGWMFKDSDDGHIFEFPQNTVIDAQGYMVISEDITAFSEHFPDVEPVSVELQFGFSGAGELLRLYNSAGELVDSLTYSDDAPWPAEADGDGATLELIDPAFDNTLPESWQASFDHGTPGAVNSASGEPCYHNGDATLDGELDVLDIVAIVSHILDDALLDEAQFCNADVIMDGQLDILDVVAIVDLILRTGF